MINNPVPLLSDAQYIQASCQFMASDVTQAIGIAYRQAQRV